MLILSNSNYFSEEAEQVYMGSTQFKRFQQCEAQAIAVLMGSWKPHSSTALLIGGFVDAYFSEELSQFVLDHPEVFNKNGSLKADFDHATKIIDRIARDKAMMTALSGEKQRIMVGEIEGVPVKIKIDSCLPDETVDLKIMANMDPVFVPGIGYRSFAEAWGYDVQGAIYQEIRAQNEGVRKPFTLAVATKEKPEPDIALLRMPQDMLDNALGIVRANIAYFDGLKKGLYEPERCETCPFCRSTKVLTGPIDYRLATMKFDD